MFCSSCSVFVTPSLSICSRVTVCTGREVSASTRLMEEPVISTRCTAAAWSGAGACARARVGAIEPSAPNAQTRQWQSAVL